MIEEKEESKDKDFDVTLWIERIKKVETKLKEKHRKLAVQAEDQYHNEDTKKVELPIYWSSIDSKAPTLYAKPPNPEIRGRNNDVTNPISKAISKVLEEVINYEIDQSDFDSDAKRAVLDFLITDLGVCRIRYDVESSEIPNELIDGGYEEVISNQKVFIDHWPWKRFLWDIGKDWAETDWICYLHYMEQKEIKKQFGHDANLSHADSHENSDNAGKFTVYEVWNKRKREVYELLEGYDKPLRVREDPLRLKGFYDCPKPLIVNMKSDKFLPQSDYKQIKKQLESLNTLQCRIDKLTESIKYRGFYDAGVKDMAALQSAPDGKFVAVDGLMSVMGNGTTADFSKALAILPIMDQAQVIGLLEQQKKEAKDQIYELTGLSDIMRGSTKASETATAQQIKSQYGQVRLMKAQTAVNSWLRNIMRIYSELIAEHFTLEQLQMISGEQVTPEMMQVLKSDVLRCYAIDIETDSTIQADESQDKQDRMEMVNTIVPMLQNIMPAIQQNVMPMEMGKTLLLTAIRGYKYTRGLEDMIEGMGDNMSQLQQLQQQLQQVGQQGQQQAEQMGMQLQQAQGMIQQLQKQLADVNMQEEQRKNAETQSEISKEGAEVEKKKAETAKIWQEIQQPMIVGNNPYLV